MLLETPAAIGYNIIMNTIKNIQNKHRIPEDNLSKEGSEGADYDNYKSSKDSGDLEFNEEDKHSLDNEFNSLPQSTNMIKERTESEEESVELYNTDDEKRYINNPYTFNLARVNLYKNKTFNYRLEKNDVAENTKESKPRQENGQLIRDKGSIYYQTHGEYFASLILNRFIILHHNYVMILIFCIRTWHKIKRE